MPHQPPRPPINITALSRILDASATSETIYLDKDGEVRSTTRSTVTPTQQLKAIDLLNKMDGTYATREAEKDLIKDEYKQWRKQTLANMRRTAAPPVVENAQAEEVEEDCTDSTSAED